MFVLKYALAQSTLRILGTSAQMTTRHDIIDTMLQTDISASASIRLGCENTYKGCNDEIPNLLASKPVANGSAAEPVIPIPLIQPTEPAKSHFGRIFLQ